jgi:hypothetical protein
MQLSRVLAEADRWPLPGGGETLLRWQLLSALAEDDLVTARLAEAHADAIAILAELEGKPAPEGSRWGVWAAEVPGHEVDFDGTSVTGAKAWCSGATLLSHALLTVRGGALVSVALDSPQVAADADTWAWPGMRAADTRTVRFEAAPATFVSDHYLRRSGFWVGGIGVAACWYGGAAAVARPLRRRLRDPHAAAHLGAVDLALGSARDVLRAAAATVDSSPTADHTRLAYRVRGTVAAVAQEVAGRVGRALGPAPYATDPEHAQRVADLEVYIRQDHAERDLATLGELVTGLDDWSL